MAATEGTFTPLDDGLDSTQSRNIARLTLGLVLLGLLWRTVRYALGFPIWGDEAMLISSLSVRDFGGMIRPLEYSQIAPVGFMWAELATTKVLGLSEWALRLLPWLAGMLSVPLFWRFCLLKNGKAGQTLNPVETLLAVAVFAASWFPVRHASEAKPYSTDLLISLVLTSAAWVVYNRPERLAGWAALTIAGAIAVWASYPAIFVLAGAGALLTLLVVRSLSRMNLVGWLVYGLCVGSSFAAMFLLIARPHANAVSWLFHDALWGPGFPPMAAPWRLPLWLLDAHTGPMMAYPIGGMNGGSTVTFILVLIGSIALWRTRRSLLLLLLSPLAFAFIAAVMKRYPYGVNARVSLYMAPAFCLLMGVGLAAALRRVLPPRRFYRGTVIAAVVVGLIAVGGMAMDCVHPYKSIWDRETRRLLREVASRTAHNDRWVIFNSLTGNPYAPNLYLCRGPGARFRYYITRLAPVPVEWSPAPDTVAPTPGGRAWLIAYQSPDIPLPAGLLDRYLQELSKGRGKPVSSMVPLGRGTEAIAIYEFPTSP